MKNIIIALIASVLFVGSAFADNSEISQVNNKADISIGLTNINYNESIGDSESGAIPSYGADVSFQNILYFAGNFQYSNGGETYNGFELFTGQPLSFSHNSTIYDGGVKLGLPISLGSNVQVTPFGEVDYQHWDRNLGSELEAYQHFSAGGGALLQVSTGHVVWTLSGAALRTLNPTMTDYTNFGFGPVTEQFNLGSSTEAKVGLRTDIALTRHQGVFAAVNYDHFLYRQSGVDVFGYYEPNSTSNFTTFTVGYAYKF